MSAYNDSWGQNVGFNIPRCPECGRKHRDWIAAKGCCREWKRILSPEKDSE